MPIWISLYDPNGHFLFSLVVATAYLFTMFGILFEFIRSFRNSATDYRSSIAFALDQFIKDHGEMGDDEIYEAILADVGNEDVANQIIVFLPISFTREHLKNQPVKLADHYYRSRSGKKSRKIRLKSLPIYNQICEIISQRRPRMTE